MKSSYDDIINHPHHVSKKRPQMSMHDRAAQFSPFAALVGFEDAVDESARLTEQRRELSVQEEAELSRRLAFLETRVAERPEISVTYFIPDGRKDGGRYETVSCAVKRISSNERTIIMQNGLKIKFSDISTLFGKLFDLTEKE